MKISEMREMQVIEAKRHVIELKSELAKERALVSSGTRKENSGKIKGMKKNIARLLTVINEKIKAGEKDVDVEQVETVSAPKPAAASAVKGLAQRLGVGGKKEQKAEKHAEKAASAKEREPEKPAARAKKSGERKADDAAGRKGAAKKKTGGKKR
ncbi:MAG: 50S ribosomal protein L29 [Candidatus Diapherotrites archaeon]|nr:50S ribosomal protein L29 [Candidatus Diapherotrites archaeon]